MQFAALVSLFAFLAPMVYGHSFITNVAGTGGKNGIGFGSEQLDMRSGHNAFFHAPRWLTSMKQYAVCGVNRRGGNTKSYGIDWKGELSQQIKKNQVPTISGSTMTLTLFQLNKDGAGPYHCEASPDATGNKWVTLPVTQNVPGNSRGESQLTNRNHIIKVKLPSNLKCTGSGGVCLARCKNPNVNAFGGCFAFKRSGSSKRDHLARRSIEEEIEVVMD